METVLASPRVVNRQQKIIKTAPVTINTSMHACKGWEKKIVWIAIKLRIFYFACILLHRPSRIWKTYQALIRLRKNVWGGDMKKMYKIGGRYYFNMYTPGWPSKAYDHIVKSELKRHANGVIADEKLRFVFLAITRKCPMRCEHCFEWDNLNLKESFTKDDLLRVLDIYHGEGVKQFHFSGGEPMARFKDLLKILEYTKGKSENWIVTSGFNLTETNAVVLKEAGCFGVVVSIDHYIPELHNIFRGHADAFDHATRAVRATTQAGLVTAMSVCATKQFIEGGHLQPYLDFAKDLGVQFVQVLEPKNIGHYEGKNVLLEEKHIQILEEFFKKINHSPEYKSYPTLMYHGYHQRRVGCFSGSRSVYIDSAGDVHACPFCHTKAYNIIDWVRSNNTKLPQKENSCPQFGRIA
jgi:MoaA/NifB/PqqE/SkfB family radical SAM enzyme